MDDKPVTRKELLEALSTVATKAELQEALAANKSETLKAIADAKTEIVAEIRDIVAESVRDSQTEILRAFLVYQDGNDLRVRTVEAKLSNVDTGLSQRVNNVERRLWEIEKKLLLNPPAA
jgi:glycosyltransferase A (GT-A) superfamily protein (DUF2064 family)